MSKITYVTSESVTEGHPDKICDQISDSILDEILKQDKNSRVAVECMVTTGSVHVAGEVTTNAYVDVQKIARETLKEIGYNDPRYGIDYEDAGVWVSIHGQSNDISIGVTENENKEQGAGDQGMMYGYACSETPELMPLPIVLAHKLTKELAYVRKNNIIPHLGPDGKSQVSIKYIDGKPDCAIAIVVAQQHTDEISEDVLREKIYKYVIEPICWDYINDETKIHINATGSFIIGGPEGDTGLTGRKIIVDTYGGVGRHGGGAFCLVGDSLVDTEKGLIQIENMKNITKSLNVKTDISPTKAEEWVNNGFMETIKLSTKDGYSLEGTNNQCLRVIDKNGNYIWRRLDEIECSDYIAIQKKNRLFGNNFDCSSFDFQHRSGTFRKNNFVFPKYLNEDYAYLMGLLTGDGNCMMSGGIAICACENEQKENIENFYNKLFGKKGKTFGHWEFFGGIELRSYLEYLGLEKKRSYDKKIPHSIFVSSKEVISAFLRGLFDTDGTVGLNGRNKNSIRISLATTSHNLALNVQQLLLNFGIISNIGKCSCAGKISEIKGRKIISRRDLYHVRIKSPESVKIFKETIGFGLSRKQNILNLINYETKIDRLCVPNQFSRIRRLWNKLPSKIKQEDKIKIGRFARPGGRKKTKQLTYDKLKKFIDCYYEFLNGDVDFEYLRTLYLSGHYYTQIRKSEKSSNIVYDITVPGAHTFTANGFVVHNSGKDASKVDRSGAYAARYIAKNIVNAELAEKCEVQISYCIGVAKPTSINIDCFGTNTIDENIIIQEIYNLCPLTPKWIIEKFGLKNPIFKKTASYGHFGRSEFPWEQTDLSIILKSRLRDV